MRPIKALTNLEDGAVEAQLIQHGHQSLSAFRLLGVQFISQYQICLFQIRLQKTKSQSACDNSVFRHVVLRAFLLSPSNRLVRTWEDDKLEDHHLNFLIKFVLLLVRNIQYFSPATLRLVG